MSGMLGRPMCPHCDEYSMPHEMVEAINNYATLRASLAAATAREGRLREALEKAKNILVRAPAVYWDAATADAVAATRAALKDPAP